jgi:hypothetical protein
VANAVEAVRQGVLEEAADELIGLQCHHLGFAIVAVVFPGEADLAVRKPDQATVGDGDAVGVAAKIGEHLRGSAQRWLGKDDPLYPRQGIEPGSEGGWIGQVGERVGKTGSSLFQVGRRSSSLPAMR